MKKLLLFSLLLLSGISFAQNVSSLCVQKVRNYSRKLDNLPLPQEGNVYYINYLTQSVMWDSVNTPPLNMDVKMWMSADHMQYITPDIEVYEDNHDAFMVVHSRRKVIRSNSELNEEGLMKANYIAALKDTLFDLSTPIKCETFRASNGKLLSRLVLRINKNVQEVFKITQLEYVYDDSTGNITKVITDYVPSYEIKRSVLTYKVCDYNYKAKHFDRPFSEKFVNRNNTLLARYRDYQLLDNR